jgi:uncharacterized protein YbjT (DUF2867 family)
MSILVTGASGTVGSQIVPRLASSGVEVKALVHTPGKVALPAGVTEVVGDLSRANSIREAGIERIVYLSVIHADLYTNVPHFTGKHTVERMIESLELPATILRPAYFIQNDERIKSVIESYGVYRRRPWAEYDSPGSITRNEAIRAQEGWRRADEPWQCIKIAFLMKFHINLMINLLT